MTVDPIEQLLTVPLERLRNKDFIVAMVREVGLHQDPSALDFYGKKNLPYLVADGMLQMPEQLAEALIFLSYKNIKQFIEVGTFNGLCTTFITAYLTRFNPSFKALTIDISRSFVNTNPSLRIVGIKGTSDDWKGFQSDLCFIDGDHSLEWVTKDYDNVGRTARYCMFHDILESKRAGMDVKAFWNSKKKPTSVEFVEGGRMGLGIL